MVFGRWHQCALMRGHIHWRQPANTIESLVCGGDTALCQIILTRHLSDVCLYSHTFAMMFFYCRKLLCNAEDITLPKNLRVIHRQDSD